MRRRVESVMFTIALTTALGACGTNTATPTTAATAEPTTSAVTSMTATPSLPASSSPSASPSGAPSIAVCSSAQLAARVVPFEPSAGVFEGWQGAAGSRFADVELTNTGPACTLSAMARPQLIEGHGAVIINGEAPGASTLLTVEPGTVLKTMVRVANYCGPLPAALPAAPVTVAFVFNDGTDRVVAVPVSAADTSGVPPCNGDPGSAGDIVMRPWAP